MEPIGKATFVGDDDILYYDAESFLDCIREELPYRDTTGFRYEVLTDDPTLTFLSYAGRPQRTGRISLPAAVFPPHRIDPSRSACGSGGGCPI